ncbi:MAG: hypothetical protein PHV82_03140 [Victivallaceae bacterium]|nr:hypothetical protein [Victivallaceae bacterium]
MKIKCDKCENEIEINPAAMLGCMTSKKKVKTSRENGKLGGRPKKKKPEQPA